MPNRISQILSQWVPQKDQLEWVLGTVVATHGPNYRNAGAMMMINSLGQSYGLLSGGCLESDITLHARKVMQSGHSKKVIYDALDEDSAWLLGIGCGGKVEILLQPIHQQNHYQQLDLVLDSLAQNQQCFYHLDIKNVQNPRNSISKSENQLSQSFLQITIQPDPNLIIFGGGLDAIPVVNVAHEMGWKTHLIDHRVTHARDHQFIHVNSIHRLRPSEILNQIDQHSSNSELHWLQQSDAAIVMTHNLSQDAEALNLLSSLKQNRLQYIGLLGPESRKQKVLLMANLSEALLPTLLHGPMGLDIGGELPESIALSIISEIHAVLEGKKIPLNQTVASLHGSKK